MVYVMCTNSIIIFIKIWGINGVVMVHISPDGCIYFAPSDMGKVLKHVTSTSTSTLEGEDYGHGYGYGSFKWYSGVYINHSVYFAPSHSKQVLKIDTNTDSTTKIGQEFSGGGKWRGGVLGGDGCVYFAPFCAKQILRVNSFKNNKCTLIGKKMTETINGMVE